jgi:hypothetical protein
MDLVMGKFKDYRTAHNFMNPGDDLKKWVDKDNYFNHYLEDWNALMELAEECLTNAYVIPKINSHKLETALLNFDKKKVFKACVKIIKEITK